MNSKFDLWKQRNKNQKFDLFYWADIFLSEYGISFEEFKKLKIPTFWILIDKINSRHKQMNKDYERAKRRK